MANINGIQSIEDFFMEYYDKSMQILLMKIQKKIQFIYIMLKNKNYYIET